MKTVCSQYLKTRVNYVFTEGGKAKTYIKKLASDIFIKCRLQIGSAYIAERLKTMLERLISNR